ncbi:GntR family transcriptional regulator [Neptunicoccus cionae]|uniref:GntR family transcriptional regulator n=1 Tax=Neptunicoccus cionae TaxID=2035344 RepID=UPI000C78A6CC|nr:GntR family transcriptional regulator [Amylibacter cionae]PLS22589.1 GntR family transcriptional regulator [Amylibacter cionae]
MTGSTIVNIPELPADEDTTGQESVYARLRHAIMIGTIEPGTNLTMRGLADAMGLSPTPVREAVRRLNSENAIEILPNRRMAIPEMTLGRFEELVALRVTLEVHAAERALPYISDIVIEKLQMLDDRMDEALRDENLDKLTVLNQRFHRMLYCVNPNQVSIPAIESVWLQLGPFQRQVVKRVKEFYKIDRHKEILSALQARDVAALMIATESDIREGISRSGRRVLTDGIG